ncbi:MAG: DUF3016 domain-containing protein [Pseudomonadota bacterium]
MKKVPLVKTASAFALLFASALACAANVEFTWDDPAQFRDIKVTNENKVRFQTRVINELEEQFRHEAEKLPADQTLHLTVHDVDLAGYVEYFHENYPFGLRVIRNVDFPAIDLTYELRDANNAVIKSGTEEIKDLGFRTPVLSDLQRDPFRYETQMIRNWYDTEFPTSS